MSDVKIPEAPDGFIRLTASVTAAEEPVLVRIDCINWSGALPMGRSCKRRVEASSCLRASMKSPHVSQPSGLPMSKGENMVERVAMAMRACDRIRVSGNMRSWGDAGEASKAKFRQYARVALQELRTPTPEMFEAGNEFINWGGNGFHQVWEAAIDAGLRTALSQPNDEGEGK